MWIARSCWAEAVGRVQKRAFLPTRVVAQRAFLPHEAIPSGGRGSRWSRYPPPPVHERSHRPRQRSTGRPPRQLRPAPPPPAVPPAPARRGLGRARLRPVQPVRAARPVPPPAGRPAPVPTRSSAASRSSSLPRRAAREGASGTTGGSAVGTGPRAVPPALFPRLGRGACPPGPVPDRIPLFPGNDQACHVAGAVLRELRPPRPLRLHAGGVGVLESPALPDVLVGGEDAVVLDRWAAVPPCISQLPAGGEPARLTADGSPHLAWGDRARR